MIYSAVGAAESVLERDRVSRAGRRPTYTVGGQSGSPITPSRDGASRG